MNGPRLNCLISLLVTVFAFVVVILVLMQPMTAILGDMSTMCPKSWQTAVRKV